MARAFADKLTPDVLAYLKSDENLTVKADSLRPIVALLAGGFVIVSLTLFLTYDFRWGIAKTAIVVTLFAIGSLCVWLGVIKFFSRRSRALQTGLITTPEYVVFSEEYSISWFPITDLATIDYKHSFNGRNYEYSTITLKVPGETRNYRIDGLDEAENLVDRIEQLKKEALVRSTKAGSAEGLNPLSNLQESPRRKPLHASIAAFGGAFVLSASLTAFGSVANEYFDDSISWDQAMTANRASSFRDYLRGHTNGRWSTEAAERLKAYYDEAEGKYKAVLGSGHDVAAVEAMLALLRYARDTHEYRVGISFERKAEIPNDLTEQLKKEFKVKKVLPLGSTFTDERMLERETQLFAYLQNTFAQIFPDDVVELVSDCSQRCAKFLVRYETSFQETIYYDVREEDLPQEDRNWSPGILIEWNFTLNVPEQAEPYSFELGSAPADTINYDNIDGSAPGSESEADQHSFYDAMVASSFDDFRAHLLFNLGLGPDPHPSDETPGIDASSKQTKK